MKRTKEERYASVHGSGKYDMTWEDVLDLVRENPSCSEGEEDQPCVCDTDGYSYTLHELCTLAGIELEILD